MNTSSTNTPAPASVEPPIFDPAGFEGPVVVRLEPGGEVDGEPYPPGVFLDSQDDGATMGFEQARAVARRILDMVDDHTDREVMPRVPLERCATWCTDGDGHPAEHPDDRSCRSASIYVATSCHDVFEGVDGEWYAAHVNAHLRRNPGEGERVLLNHQAGNGTDVWLELAPAEAARLGAALLELAEAAALPERLV